jgi:hypothetical protein
MRSAPPGPEVPAAQEFGACEETASKSWPELANLSYVGQLLIVGTW